MLVLRLALICVLPFSVKAQSASRTPNQLLSLLRVIDDIITEDLRYADLCPASQARLVAVIRNKVDASRLVYRENDSQTPQGRRGWVYLNVNTLNPYASNMCEASITVELRRWLTVPGTQNGGTGVAFSCGFIIRIGRYQYEDEIASIISRCTDELLSEWVRVNPKG